MVNLNAVKFETRSIVQIECHLKHTHVADSLFTATISFNTVRTEAKKVLSNSSHSFATLSCVLCKITGKLHVFDVSAQIQIDTYMLELLAYVRARRFM